MSKPINCSKCGDNEGGICVLIGKEIPLSYAANRNRKRPAFCPLDKKNRR